VEGISYAKAVWQSENESQKLILPKIHFKPQKQVKKMKVYFDAEIAEKTINKAHYAKNTLFQFALGLCENEMEKQRVLEVFEQYLVGTCSEGTVFWFKDCEGRYHAGQVKKFSLETGKTESETWVHTVLHKQDSGASWLKRYYDQEGKVDCLYGEHLLCLPQNAGKVIVLVESPKNAILSEIFLPRQDAIYLATYSLSAFTPQRCMAVIGRKVQLLPDLGRATETWKQTAPKFLPAGSYCFIDYLERIATDNDRKEGKDIADFIIANRQARKGFIPHDVYVSRLVRELDLVLYKDDTGSYPASWDFNAPYISQETRDYVCALE
jgi:hypothetical protein